MDLLKRTKIRNRSRSRGRTPEFIPNGSPRPPSRDSAFASVPCEPGIAEGALAVTLDTPPNILESFSVSPALSRAINQRIIQIPASDRKAFLSADDILSKMKEMNNEHSQSSLLRSLGSRVQKILTCVHTFLECVKTFIQHNPEGSSLVVGGINCVLVLALGYIEFFETLTGMLERVGGHLSYLSKYASLLFQSSPDIQEALASAYCDLLDLFVFTRGVFTNKDGAVSRLTSFKLFFRLTWEPLQAEFRNIQARFLDHSEVVIRVAQVQQRIDENEASLRKQELKEKKRKERKRTEILKWLSPEDFEESHSRHYSKRFGDTGQWFLDEQRLNSWVSSSLNRSSLLWCHGMPGVGKSVLFALALDRLVEKYQLSGDTGIAFAYCYYKTPLEPTTYIQVFIKQLCRTLEDIPAELEQLYDKHNRNASVPVFLEFQEVFLAVSRHFKRVFVLLDALDECNTETRATLYRFFESTISSGAKLFIASRKEPDIERGFKLFPTIEIEASKVMADIDAYVTTRLEEYISDGSLTLRDPSLKDKIRNALLSKAEGMFLWVDFQLQNIKAQRSDRAIEDALRSLPEDMHDTYERIIVGIHAQPKGDRELAKKILMWIALAKRPMKLDELAEALAMSAECKSYSDLLPYIVNDKEMLIALCGNLVVTTHTVGKRIPINVTLRFVHYSVQEYLCEAPLDVCKPENRSIITQYRVDNQLSHTTIARLLIVYLISCRVEGRVTHEYKYGGLFIYAASCWLDHIRAVKRIDDDLLTLLRVLFDLGCVLTPTLIVSDSSKTTCYVWHRAGTTSSLVIAALVFGLPRILDILPAEELSQPCGKNGFEILHYAVKNDCLQAAEILLEQGSDINALDDDGATPLFHARSKSMTKLLLDSGANPDTKDVTSQGRLFFKVGIDLPRERPPIEPQPL